VNLRLRYTFREGSDRWLVALRVKLTNTLVP